MKYLLITILLFAFNFQQLSGQEAIIKRPFPREVNYKVKFELPLAEFEEGFKREKIERDNSYGFRIVYTQKVDRRNVKDIIYYFDADGDQPLYEVIVSYNDEETPRVIAERRFGAPNYKQEEWRFRYKDHDIWCWVYNNKIVIAAKVPDTEWYEDWNK